MKNLTKNNQDNFLTSILERDTKHFLKMGVFAAFAVLIFAVNANSSSLVAHTDSRVNLAAAVAHAAKCENNADVTIGLGGLGTGILPQLSNGVYYPTKATPGGKYFGCMVVACRDIMGRATRYVQQQAAAANGRRITVDIIGHSAGADGSVHLARALANNPNIYVRRIVAADATAFAGRVPSGVGHVVNLNSTWNGKTPLSGSSPIQYVNRADKDHFSIDDLIPENLPCLGGENECKSGDGEQCKNRCSTTFTEVEGSTPKVTDCYEKGEDKAQPAIEALAKCVEANATATDKPGEPELKKAICIDNKDVTVDEASGAVANATAAPVGESVKIPKACEQELKTILDIRKGEDAQTSAKKEDIAACKWKGAVVCFPDTASPGSFTCKKKVDAASETSTAPNNSVTQCVLNNRGNQSAVTQCLQSQATAPVPPGTTGLGGSPFGGDQGSQTSQNAFTEPEQTCPTGYTSKTEGGKKFCAKDEKESSETKPQCLFVASKEEISSGETVEFQWRTAGAEKVSITGVTDTVEKSGTTTVKPTKTTTYTLTAEGKGSDNKKTCELTVTVEGGEDEFTGENQPLLGCADELVAKGASTEIIWSCADGADSIQSVGFNTEGKLKGTSTVSLQQNTQYEVSCLQKGKKVGSNACSVRVGEPKLGVLVYPEQVEVGERVRVSWASLFMKSCRVQGPRGFDYTRTQGVVITEPFTAQHAQTNVQTAEYKVVCESEFEGTVSKDVVVRLKK